MEKYPLHPQEMNIGLYPVASKISVAVIVIVSITVAAAIYFIIKKHKNDKEKK